MIGGRRGRGMLYDDVEQQFGLKKMKGPVRVGSFFHSVSSFHKGFILLQ